MRYTKNFGFLVSAIVLGIAFMTVSASSAAAQIRVGVSFGHRYYRPRVVQRYYAPVYPFGYYNRPYGRARSERYYDRQSLNYAKNRLNNDEDRYDDDGYISPKEQQKLDSDYYKLNRDRRRLRNDW